MINDDVSINIVIFIVSETQSSEVFSINIQSVRPALFFSHFLKKRIAYINLL
jgi:hypothetical protein